MYHLIDYVWCVEKFAKYFEAHKQEVYPLLTSPIFAYKNTRWVLNLYPEGLGDSASQGYISLFIKYVSEDPENINAKVELSLLNNKNERVYCRDTGDHQYQTFIDFGYKQFLKIQDIKEQKDDLILNGVLKIFARVEFEHATLPSSLTWSNYDLLLFKENFKDLYETKNLCDIVIRVVCKSKVAADLGLPCWQPVKRHANFFSTSSSSNNNVDFSFNDSYCCSSNGSNLVSMENENSLLSSNHHLQQHNLDFNHSISMNLESPTTPPSPLQPSSSSPIILNETLEIKSHKFILASRSGKFRELLKTNIIKIASSHPSSSSSRTPLALSNVQPCCNCTVNQTTPSPSTGASTSTYASQSQENDQITCQCGAAQQNQHLELMTDSGDSDSISDLLIIETDRSPKVIEYLIRYMYTGYLDTLDSYAKDIYEISKEYKVHGLTNLAREHIIKELHIQNCCDFFGFLCCQ